jgi:tripartite-type tricarboxylate transporter receptor subunit TctC
VLTDADTRNRFDQRGMDLMISTPDEFAALIRAEIPKWAKVIRAAGIQPE